MLTFDVRNTFNTAILPKITEMIMGKRVLSYLSNIRIYLSDRSIKFRPVNGKTKRMKVNYGIP